MLGSDNVLTGLFSASLINCKDIISCPWAYLPSRDGDCTASDSQNVDTAMCDINTISSAMCFISVLRDRVSRLMP